MQLQIIRTEGKKHVPDSKEVSAAVPKADKSSLPMFVRTAVAGESRRNLDLDARMREKIERQFGLDFSGVRLVESDLPAKLGTNAMAQGDLIRFAPGAFRPETAQGERLLSHELSHIVQQSQGDAMNGAAGQPFYDPNTEHSADAMADRAMRGDLATGSVQPFTPIPAEQTPMLGCNFFKKLFGKNKHNREEYTPLLENGSGPPPLQGGSILPEQNDWVEIVSEDEDNEQPITQGEDETAAPPKTPAWEREMPLERLSLKEKFDGENEEDSAARIKEAYNQRYNPDGDEIFQKTLELIVNAKSVEEAQNAFIIGTGQSKNFNGNIGGTDGADKLDLRLVKKNLCAIARVMHDIPALKGVLSGFEGTEDHLQIIMDSLPSIDLIEIKNENENQDQNQNQNQNHPYTFVRSHTIGWNSNEKKGNSQSGSYDAAYMVGSKQADKERRKNSREEPGSNFSASSASYFGAHEMGHIATGELTYLILSNWLKGRNNKEKDIVDEASYYFYFLYYTDLIGNFILQDAIAELYKENREANEANTTDLIIFNGLEKFLEKFILNNQPGNDAHSTKQGKIPTSKEMQEKARNLNFISREKFSSQEAYYTASKKTGDYEPKESKKSLIDILIEAKSDRDAKEKIWNDAGQAVKKSENMLKELYDHGLTSVYGKKDSMEFIAEAFADVYNKGKSANPMSKKIVEIITNRLKPSKENKNWEEDIYNRFNIWRKKFYNAELA
ncbi:MAG: DUF4157 domain-containing protein [Oscillospiraceae bacterium]|nr:DUF4157 domain-containing protein [Oscillospiraceae bacterium]